MAYAKVTIEMEGQDDPFVVELNDIDINLKRSTKHIGGQDGKFQLSNNKYVLIHGFVATGENEE